MERYRAIIKQSFYLLLLSVAFCASTANAIPNKTITPGTLSELLRLHLQARNPKAGNIGLRSADLLRRFYQQRAYQPAWFDHSGNPLPAAEQLIDAVDNAASTGLRPQFYQREALVKTLAAVTLAPKTAQVLQLELLMSDAFFSYGSHLLSGRLQARRFHPDWTLETRSADLIAVLERALAAQAIDQALHSLESPHGAYQRLKAVLAHYRKIERAGGWEAIGTGKILKQGMTDLRVRALRKRLTISADLSSGEALSNSAANRSGAEFVFDQDLRQAVQKFQRRHGLLEDGIVGPNTLAKLNVTVSERIRQIELNLERWRWMPADLGQRHIMVNIPGFEMQLVENGRPVFRSKVVVGRSDRQTPIFSDSMSHLVLSPYWNVPRSIALKDKLPILRKSPHALKRQKIRIFNSAGREINPSRIDWRSVSSRNFKYRLRQDPGPKNALGKVKFMFPNRHSVYLHDTSSPQLFSRHSRAFSSGCIRVAKPLELAARLLQHDPRWNHDTLAKAGRKRRQKTVHLPSEIPVHLMYWTVWQDDDGVVHFRDDIYHRDQPLQQALHKETQKSG